MNNVRELRSRSLMWWVITPQRRGKLSESLYQRSSAIVQTYEYLFQYKLLQREHHIFVTLRHSSQLNTKAPVLFIRCPVVLIEEKIQQSLYLWKNTKQVVFRHQNARLTIKYPSSTNKLWKDFEWSNALLAHVVGVNLRTFSTS